MPHMQPTRVMTLGRLGMGSTWQSSPSANLPTAVAYPGAASRANLRAMIGPTRGLGTVYLRATTRQPNFLSQTMTSGIGRTGRFLMGLGQAASDLIDPWAADAKGENVINQEAAAGGLQPLPGQSVPTPNVALDPAWYAKDYDLPGERFDHTWLSKGGTLAGLGVLSLGSGILSAYHGYRRDRGSVGSAFGWFILGAMFPVVTPAAAFLSNPKGFAKPRKGR